MSYILDALRKSEQERQRGKVPDIHGAASDAPDTGKKPNIWPAITAGVVSVNLAILGFFWFQFGGNPAMNDQNTESVAVVDPLAVQSKSDSVQSAQPVPKLTPKPEPKPQPSKPATEYAQQPSPQPELIQPEKWAEPESQRVPNVGYLPQLEELPAYERDGIPDMTFSSHMYSSIPRFRSIIINGKRLKEGQYFNEQLQVREITESGVVLSRGGTLFEVDVLGRWAQ